ncbi:hypothetical protein EES41_41065 (plasmid) [Streptomyces sp. ADI95-16]|uniref:hypothetical protein n=1 Tax=Streptomyces sp. ADI95-16 TaxID=1522758 RepID=UPI000F42E280|nr:hypothetical protein [Streptomyces sp. ADI95-16]AYV33171.1 hypothetical protein EES41_41065 [Streptomyces sp. ADI95-16]
MDERDGWTRAQRAAESAMWIEASVRAAEAREQEQRDRAAEQRAAERGFTVGRIEGAL